MSIIPRATRKAVRLGRNYFYSLKSMNLTLPENTPPHQALHGISDEYWFWLNAEGIRRNPTLQRVLPGVPEEHLQATYTGAKGEHTLREGWNFYRLCKELFERHVKPLPEAAAVLDFGCGWGRILRFFLKDLAPAALHGADQSDVAIAACKQTYASCQFTLIPAEPPTPFADGSFDLIYCYSVFSHLPEPMHLRLLTEFRRLLRPGGLLIATTRPRRFITFCASLRARPDIDSAPDWLKISAPAFPDTAESLARYDAGDYCYHSFALDGQWSFWGEACIPRGYAMTHWSRFFEVIDYIDDPGRCAQNVIVAARR